MLDEHDDARPVKDRPFGPIRWAWGLRGLQPIERLVLLKLIDHDHIDKTTKTRKGIVWPSQSALARELGLERKAISRHIRSLEAKGLIVRSGAAANGVLKLSINYGIACDNKSQPPDAGCDNMSQVKDAGCDNKSQVGETISLSRVGHIVAQTDKQQPRATGEAVRCVPHLTHEQLTAPRFADASLVATPRADVEFVEIDGVEVVHDRDCQPGEPVVVDEPAAREPHEPNKTRSTGCDKLSQPLDDRAKLIEFWVARCTADADRYFVEVPDEIYSAVIRRIYGDSYAA